MSGARPGALLVHESPADAWVRGVERRLAREGYETATAAVAGDDGVAAADRELSGRLEEELARLAERETVDGDRLCAIGFGIGGTHAFLLGCTSRRPTAVVVSEAPLVYAELSPAHPVQPLELALNLTAPLLAIFTGASAEEADRLRSVGSQFAKDFDIVRLPEATGAFHRALGGEDGARDGAAAEQAWNRMLTFLYERLELTELDLEPTDTQRS